MVKIDTEHSMCKTHERISIEYLCNYRYYSIESSKNNSNSIIQLGKKINDVLKIWSILNKIIAPEYIIWERTEYQNTSISQQ